MELPDDCLMLIFKRLDIRDQIAAASAHQRFREVLAHMWQRAFIDFSDAKLNHIICSDLSILLKCICRTVQSMKLYFLSYERFQVLKLYKYPNMKKFKFFDEDRHRLKDVNISEMTKLFPKLEYLKPSGAFSGMYMEKWRHLQHLDLSMCSMKKFQCLETIFERSNLKSIELNVFRRFYKWQSRRAFKNFCNLERITVNSYELKWLLDIKKFKNLKKLSVYDLDRENSFCELLLNLHNLMSNEVLEISTKTIFPFCVPVESSFSNLRRLVVYEQNISEYRDVRVAAPNLREIVFVNCKLLEQKDIFVWLNDSARLDLISLDQCYCVCKELTIDVDDIVQQRKEVLQFNFAKNTYLDHAEEYFDPYMCYIPIKLNIQGSSPLFKVTKENLPYNFMTLSVQFQ